MGFDDLSVQADDDQGGHGELLEVYGKAGVCPGVKEHFECVDGAGGFFSAEVRTRSSSSSTSSPTRSS
jgi:hypothetical protein